MSNPAHDCHTCRTPCCHHFRDCACRSPCSCAMSRGSPTANRIWLDNAGLVDKGTFGHYQFEQVVDKCFAECRRHREGKG